MKKIMLVILVICLVGCQNVQSGVDENDLESSSEIMNVKTIAKLNYSETTNYIFHMYSVAKIGYDNDYGNTYRDLHSSEDLEFLKSIEEDLTLDDQHTKGELSGVLIFAASLDTLEELELYFNSIIHSIGGEDFSEDERLVLQKISDDLQTHGRFITVGHFNDYFASFNQDTIETLSTVFINNIPIYSNGAQANEKTNVDLYIERFENEKSLDNRIGALENLIGLTYTEKEFLVQLTNSTKHGSNGIETGYDSKQFYTSDFTVLDECITNEIIAQILMQNEKIKGMMKSHPEGNVYLESLAEYYNREYYNRKTLSVTEVNESLIEFYEVNKELPVIELFKLALESIEI